MLMFEDEEYTCWHAIKDEHEIVWLTLDNKDSTVNSLSLTVFNELREILIKLEKDVHIKIKGLVIQSAHKEGFSGGVDINLFKDLGTAELASDLARKGQAIFNQIHMLSCPTLALINGYCVGGGLELALACDYRIVLNDTKIKIGLPEVKLGIHPGFGGTVRLLKLINLYKAFDLILTGRIISGIYAKKIGLIDELVPKRHITKAINHYLLKKPLPKKQPMINKILHLDFIRPFIGKMITKKLEKNLNKEHYPAQYAVIDNWVLSNINSSKAYETEAKSIGKFLVSENVNNLVRVFFLKEKLHHIAKSVNYKPKHVHIIGSGVMGGSIGAICAACGYRVTIQDKNLKAISNTFRRANDYFEKTLGQEHLIVKARDNLMPDLEGLGVYIADFIIEAVDENEKLKLEIISKMENEAKKDVILVTTSSAISLSNLNKNMKDKSRLVRMYFFNPVTKIPLVEMSFFEKVDQKIKDRAISFVGGLGKLPLEVQNSPGFLTFRVIVPYIMESITMYNEGHAPELIDKAAKDFGMFIGPIELADIIGLDVCKKSFEYLGVEVPMIINEMIDNGNLGKKSNKGFYEYKNGVSIKKKIDESSALPHDATDRLITIILNEAVKCLREGIVSSEDLLDAGLVFGLGFAPFLGGPMNYIKGKNRSVIKNKLVDLKEKYGARFTPDEGWAV